jgi:hypothetical protein
MGDVPQTVQSAVSLTPFSPDLRRLDRLRYITT